MIRHTMLLLIAAPALAQDADPVNQLIEGYITCFMAHGDPDVVAPNLGLYGWTHDDPQDGIAIAQPGVGGDTFVLIAEDASFCHVESMTIGTLRAATALGYAMAGAGTSVPEPGQNDIGCPIYDFGAGITATLTGGGAEPACTSDTTSTLRFDFAPAP